VAAKFIPDADLTNTEAPEAADDGYWHSYIVSLPHARLRRGVSSQEAWHM